MKSLEIREVESLRYSVRVNFNCTLNIMICNQIVFVALVMGVFVEAY